MWRGWNGADFRLILHDMAHWKRSRPNTLWRIKWGIIFFCPPSNYSLFLIRICGPLDGLRSLKGRQESPTGMPVPSQNGSRKCESSQKPPGDPAGAGAVFLVLEASSNWTSKPWAKLSQWCAPCRHNSVSLASCVVRRIWLPGRGVLTTHKGSTQSHYDGDPHFLQESQNSAPTSHIPGC